MHLVFPSSELCLANMCDSDKYAIEYELQRQNGEKKIREKKVCLFSPTLWCTFISDKIL